MSRRPRRRAPSCCRRPWSKIDTDENNRVTAVHWYDQARKSHKATGRHFVLACNALETPRLLLMAANERNPRHCQFV